MFSKLFSAILCVFMTCSPETSEAGKFVEIPDTQVQAYVEPKPYKETTKNPYSCIEKYYSQSISGTGAEAKKAYKAYGECLLAIHNEQAMPKEVACKQKDGLIDYKLQFSWNFANQVYFIDAGNWGFSKFGNKLYYTIAEHGFEADVQGKTKFFNYDCGTKKTIETTIPILVPYWAIVPKYFSSLSGKLILEIGGHAFRGGSVPFSIGIYNQEKNIVQQLFLFNEQIDEGYKNVQSDFSGSEIIQPKITQYINDYGVGKYMEKHSNKIEYGIDPRSDFIRFATFDLIDIKSNLRGKLVVTMPGFKAIFNIDLKNKKIWR